MFQDQVTVSVESILSRIPPFYYGVSFIVVFVIALIASITILFHLNKYREYNPATIKAQLVYVVGIIILFIFAFIFLILSAV
jgi:uncharacterized membrane protein